MEGNGLNLLLESIGKIIKNYKMKKQNLQLISLIALILISILAYAFYNSFQNTDDLNLAPKKITPQKIVEKQPDTKVLGKEPIYNKNVFNNMFSRKTNE